MAQNTFEGTNLKFRNQTIHFILAEIIKFRKQLTVRPEFRQQSGWDNALNKFMVDQLESIADTLENITYNPSPATLEDLEEESADTANSLAKDYDAGVYSIHSDNVVQSVEPEIEIIWDLTGANLDIPQPTEDKFKNDFGRLFIKGLDALFTHLTRLDCRHQGSGITKYQSVMTRGKLDALFTITQRKGGEVNKTNIAAGTLPSEEADTFKG